MQIEKLQRRGSEGSGEVSMESGDEEMEEDMSEAVSELSELPVVKPTDKKPTKPVKVLQKVNFASLNQK